MRSLTAHPALGWWQRVGRMAHGEAVVHAAPPGFPDRSRAAKLTSVSRARLSPYSRRIRPCRFPPSPRVPEGRSLPDRYFSAGQRCFPLPRRIYPSWFILPKVVHTMLRKLVIVVVFVAVLVTLVGICGCAKKTESTVAPPVQPPPPAANAPAAPAGEFAWTGAPTVAMIPSGPVKGMINGKAFEAKTVRIKQGDKSPSIEISDMAVEEPSGMLSGDTGAELDFPLPAGKPGEYARDVKTEKTFDKEHAYYYYPQGGDKGPMSVNPSWGAALKIDSWTSEKDPKDPDVLGKVKGKVVIVFDDEKKSWVAGDFDGVYYK